MYISVQTDTFMLEIIENSQLKRVFLHIENKPNIIFTHIQNTKLNYKNSHCDFMTTTQSYKIRGKFHLLYKQANLLIRFEILELQIRKFLFILTNKDASQKFFKKIFNFMPTFSYMYECPLSTFFFATYLRTILFYSILRLLELAFPKTDLKRPKPEFVPFK